MCFSSPAQVATPAPAVASTTGPAKAAIPGAKANAVARAGGGISPEFLSGLVSEQTGTPGSWLDVLSDIRTSLGQGGG
jgi:hypothetical protein